MNELVNNRPVGNIFTLAPGLRIGLEIRRTEDRYSRMFCFAWYAELQDNHPTHLTYGDVSYDALIRRDDNVECRMTSKSSVWDLSQSRRNRCCERSIAFNEPTQSGVSDNMYIYIKLNVVSTTYNNCVPKQWFNTDKQHMSAQFRTLFGEGNHTGDHDIEIRCNDGSVWAHKIILRTRSHVLNEMIELCERDKDEVIRLELYSRTIVNVFVEWLYTGELSGIIHLDMMKEREKQSDVINSIIQLYRLALELGSEDLMERLCVLVVLESDTNTLLEMASMGKHTPAYKMIREHYTCENETGVNIEGQSHMTL